MQFDDHVRPPCNGVYGVLGSCADLSSASPSAMICSLMCTFVYFFAGLHIAQKLLDGRPQAMTHVNEATELRAQFLLASCNIMCIFHR